MSLAINFQSRRLFGELADSAGQRRYSTIDSVISQSDGICFVELRRSAPYSFSPLMLRELLDCARSNLAGAGQAIGVRALVSKRKGVFSLGGDLAFFRSCITDQNQTALAEYADMAVDLVWESLTASGCEQVTSVAVVQGEAQGGGFEAALASHVLIAERGSWFGFPEGLFGLFPGMGARELLVARGAGRVAGKLIGSARRISAEELYSMGVVDVLAETGGGIDALRDVAGAQDSAQLADLRGRFGGIHKASLHESVAYWVDMVMKLPSKHLQTIEYLIQAQQRVRNNLPNVRVV